MNLRFTAHAEFVMRERGILPDWVDTTVEHPTRRDAAADGTVHYLRRIHQFGGRWLRVVLNDTVDPRMVVTVFFDRRVR